MTEERAAILPFIRTLPLSEDAQTLFSRALVAVMGRRSDFAAVGAWLDTHYSEQAVYERMLPDKLHTWDCDRADWTSAPSKGELDSRITGRTFTRQQAGIWREHLRQHREARALNHPKYREAMAERRDRLRKLREESKTWRPSLRKRLELAVREIIEAEYPDPPEHSEHSRRIVGIGVLLVSADPLPVLGVLGQWEWASKLDTTCDADPTKPSGNLLRKLSRPPAQNGPHTSPLHVLHPRHEGREEVLFERMPGAPRQLQLQWGDLTDFGSVLRVAVDELEQITRTARPDSSSAVVAARTGSPKPAESSVTGDAALSKEAKALAALTDHPEWTEEQIAQAAGCHRNSLYRMKRFCDAKRMLMQGNCRLPRGSKDGESGDVEAWDPDCND